MGVNPSPGMVDGQRTADMLHQFMVDGNNPHRRRTQPYQYYSAKWLTYRLKQNDIYAQMEAMIKEEFNRNPNDFERRINYYRDAAETAPSDPIKLFRWACSECLMVPRYSRRGESWRFTSNRMQEFDLLGWLLAAAPTPPSFEYAKYRIAIECYMSPTRPDLLSLTKKMAATQPNDDILLKALIFQLSESYATGDKEEAVRLANLATKRDPNPENLATEVWADYDLWASNGGLTTENARRVLLAYQKLQKAVPSSSFYSRHYRLMADICGRFIHDQRGK
jgi:hypothetical protein